MTSVTEPAKRAGERGVILVNVLAVMALSSIVVLSMLSLQDTSIQRSQRFSEAAQAAIAALGGETSAIVALRRDADEAPDSDNYGEAWAKLAETAAPIDFGTFTLSIEDAQSRFNINSLVSGGAIAVEALRKIALALGLPGGVAELVAARMRAVGPIARLDMLRLLGADQPTLDRLGSLVTTLPENTPVNINTADEGLLAILLGNRVAARVLVSRRERSGFLTKDDIVRAGVVLPPGVGFTSNYFRVTIEVRIGDTMQRLTSLLQRRRQNGRPHVVVISRERGMAAPQRAPPFD